MSSKALLCGINKYKYQPELRGCINDVRNINQLLITNFNFAKSNICELVDEEVTKFNLRQKWQWLIQDAQPGDRLIFHFSGHGSYIPDDSDEESDGYDEITCLYDMDFYDSETFFRDDEWNQEIQQIPSGVELIIILDTCHSGDGTRMLPVNLQGRSINVSVELDGELRSTMTRMLPSLQEENVAPKLLDSTQYQQILAQKNVKFLRFIQPPAELQERVVKNAHTRLLSTPGIQINQHLLLAACQESQTAADAYLDGDFHGAFTYYFCQTIRQFPQIGTQKLIELVTEQLESNNFSQRPQHQGQNIPNPIFGTSSSNTITTEITPKIMNSTQQISQENQKLLIEAYIKLLDTVNHQDQELTLATQRSITNNRYLVYVHGISDHETGYSDGWWKALQPHVNGLFGNGELRDTRREVIWSDLVNNTRSLGSFDEEEQTNQLRQDIEAVLEDRYRQQIAIYSQGRNNTRQTINPVSARGGGFAIDDFLIYMINSSMRQRIIDRFTNIVEPLLDGNNSIDIIAHSWGAVVAYEGLREIESRQSSRSGKVNNLFTVGSALSIAPVRSALRAANRNGERPSFVENWINLDAKGDRVGGLHRGKLEITEEFLELIPTGCTREWFGYSLGCAHSSYFKEDNLTVNRDIFARFINSFA